MTIDVFILVYHKHHHYNCLNRLTRVIENMLNEKATPTAVERGFSRHVPRLFFIVIMKPSIAIAKPIHAAYSGGTIPTPARTNIVAPIKESAIPTA